MKDERTSSMKATPSCAPTKWNGFLWLARTGRSLDVPGLLSVPLWLTYWSRPVEHGCCLSPLSSPAFHGIDCLSNSVLWRTASLGNHLFEGHSVRAHLIVVHSSVHGSGSYPPSRSRLQAGQRRVGLKIAHVGVPLSINYGCSKSMMHKAINMPWTEARKTPRGTIFLAQPGFVCNKIVSLGRMSLSELDARLALIRFSIC